MSDYAELVERLREREEWAAADAIKALEERSERAEAIAKGWAEAADRARQPDVFYKDYNEGTMRAMQVLLSKASVKLAECMAHANALEDEIFHLSAYDSNDAVIAYRADFPKEPSDDK